MQSGFTWAAFGILVGAGYIGFIAAVPYWMTLDKLFSVVSDESIEEISKSIIGELFGIPAAVLVGLFLAHKVGLGSPLLAALLAGQPIEPLWQVFLVPTLVVGAGSGIVLALLDGANARLQSREKPQTRVRPIAYWRQILFSLHEGITVEIIYRFGGLTFTVGLLGLIWHTSAGLPTSGVFWTAIIVSALFTSLQAAVGLGALFDFNFKIISPFYLIMLFFLNCLIVGAYGYIYWQYGLEAVMLTHFTASIVRSTL